MTGTTTLGKVLRKAIDKGDEVALKTHLKTLEGVISRDFPNGKRVRQNAWTRSQWWQSLRQRAAKKKKAEATRRVTKVLSLVVHQNTDQNVGYKS